MKSQNTPALDENIKKLVGLLEQQSAMAQSNRLTEGVSTSSSLSKDELNKILGHRRKHLFKPRTQTVQNIFNHIKSKP